ncbi:MAG: ribbon-helix-helix protein, CopG family [Nitrospinae bacterium]|nr:ribbon-helix-helix protein, CopG family [Nitrospinota bacterium]
MPTSVRLPDKLDRGLEELAQKTGRSKAYYIREAIQEYLEDRRDYLMAVRRLENPRRRWTMQEVKKLLDDLAD